jgi:hypothetical protein
MDLTEITETKDQGATHHGSTLGTDLSGLAAQLEGGRGQTRARRYTEVRKKTTTLQKKLDAIWTSQTPGIGGVRFGPISTTPLGSNPVPPQIPGAPVQNRMCGVPYDQNGGAGPPQYTPQPFGGFNPGQPYGSIYADGGKPSMDTYADAVWCAQYEPTVPSSDLRRSATANDAAGADAIPSGRGTG